MAVPQELLLAPLTSKFRQLRYETWAEFKWDVALPKAAINYWNADVFEPTVGLEVRARQRSFWLPARKVNSPPYYLLTSMRGCARVTKVDACAKFALASRQ